MEETVNYQVTYQVNTNNITIWLERYFNTKDIKESLLELPEIIATQKEAVRKLRDAFQEADLPRKMLELEMVDDIASEINPQTGKVMYSNDKLRDAELKRRKIKDMEYQDSQGQAKRAERDLVSAEDELAQFEQKFAAYCKASEFVAAEMNLVAALVVAPGAIGNAPAGYSASIDDYSIKQPY